MQLDSIIFYYKLHRLNNARRDIRVRSIETCRTVSYGFAYFGEKVKIKQTKNHPPRAVNARIGYGRFCWSAPRSTTVRRATGEIDCPGRNVSRADPPAGRRGPR